MTQLDEHPPGPRDDGTVTPFRDVNADSVPRQIADLLRDARLAKGIEIGEAARALRIRQVYLEALEEGRFSDLPGDTYVAGFLRTYGRYLGLDGEELVRLFKDEIGGRLNKPELNFPVPSSEARRPTGALIVGALCVAVAVVVIWYALQERNLIDLELVSEVPDELARLTGVDDASEAPAAEVVEAPSAGTEPDAATPGTEAAPAASVVEADAPEEDATPALSGLDDGEAAQPDDVESALPAAEPEVDPAVGVDAAAGAAEETAGSAADTATDAGIETEPLQASGDAPEATAAEEEGDVFAATDALLSSGTEDGYVPRIYGRTNTDSRIEIRALGESWVQIEDDRGAILLTRILLPGDVYWVPNRPGIRLDTGDAGNLEILVDDRKIAPLGASGDVVKDVLLEPDSLRSH